MIYGAIQQFVAFTRHAWGNNLAFRMNTIAMKLRIRVLWGMLILLNLAWVGKAQCQYYYNAPMATSYNYTKDRYYVANYGAKEILEIDRAGNKRLLMNGLQAPVNVNFGKFPKGFAVVVIDSTRWIFADTAGKVLLDTSFAAVGGIADCVLDEANGVLYTTDKVHGKIWKMEFQSSGGWSNVKFSTLCSGIPKASALILQANLGRLLVVQDTLNSKLIAVNLSNGGVGSLRSLNLSNVVGLAEDAQGNLYFAAQAEQYIYQLNKYYSGSPKAILREPKPGDVTINIYKDEWAYCCLLCGKVYVARLHIFGPGTEERKCAGDSVISGKNIFLKNIGTFDTGNEFIMELSDDKGSFASGYVLGKIADSLVPSMMVGVMPKGIPSGLGYRLRWRSTKPAVEGWLVMSEILPALPLKLSSFGDTMAICSGDSVTLFAGYDISRINYYYWFVNQDSVPTKTEFESQLKVKTQPAKWVKVVAKDLEYGCKSVDSVFVMPVASPQIEVLDTTIVACDKEVVKLGRLAAGKVLGNSGLMVRWLKSDAQLQLDSNWSLRWDTFAVKRSVLQSKQLWGVAKNQWGCGVNWKQNLVVNPYDTVAISVVMDSILAVKSHGKSAVYWYRNDTLYGKQGDTLRYSKTKDTQYFKACTRNENCEFCSPVTKINPKPANSVWDIVLSDMQLYPNPAQDMITLQGLGNLDPLRLTVMDIRGKQWLLRDVNGALQIHLNVAALPQGMYLVQVANLGALHTSPRIIGKFVK